MDAVKVKAPRTKWKLECREPDGTLAWEEEINNTVMDAGINALITAFFKGANYTAQWFIGLMNSGATTAAEDVAVNHPGWTEFTAYSATGRPSLILGVVQNKAVDNSDNRAVFTATGNGVIGGAFLISANDKGGGNGILYAAAAFVSGDKSVTAGSTLAVTCQVTGEDSVV